MKRRKNVVVLVVPPSDGCTKAMLFGMKYPYQQSEREKKEANKDYPWYLNSTKRKVVLDKIIELARHREHEDIIKRVTFFVSFE